jgi:pyruvate dehydrogenase E2 component (dihydrolipoamide acetyltransferase)
LHAVSGSGPGGRVTAEDVRTFVGQSEKDEAQPQDTPSREQAATEQASQKDATAESTETSQEDTSQSERRRPLDVDVPELPDFSRWGPIEHEPLKSIRRVIAKRMSVAWSQIPHVTHQDIADITELEAFRQRHSEEIKQQDGSLSLTVFVLRALVATLKQFPRFNASLDPQAGQIILKRYYHIGVAVDTDRGLIVPVIRDVDRKSIVELSKELSQLVERVRNGKLKPDDVQGGTFTITNPGPLGGTAFTPIINYPEVAILGLARARLEPVVQGDLDRFRITPRLRLPIHLTFDHRVNDGADAARFVNMLIELLQEPDLFLLNV